MKLKRHEHKSEGQEGDHPYRRASGSLGKQNAEMSPKAVRVVG